MWSFEKVILDRMVGGVGKEVEMNIIYLSGLLTQNEHDLWGRSVRRTFFEAVELCSSRRVERIPEHKERI